MMAQYKTVFKIIFFISIINILSIQAQQLALPNKSIAEIGNDKITETDFLNRYSEYLHSTGAKDNIVTRRAILNNMINEILLLKYDDNSKILHDEEFLKEKSWNEKQTILAFMKDHDIYANIRVSDKELRDAFYKSNMKISARHLFAQTEEEANSLYQLLQTGSTFNSLAKQVFTDSTLRNNGGYLGFFSWGDMDPAFEDRAFSLKPGEVSKPVKTSTGYSIIKVEERVPNPILTEDQFLRGKQHIERIVRIRKMKPEEEAYVKKIFNPDRVVFNEKLLGNVIKNLGYSRSSSVEKEKAIRTNETCVRFGNKKYTVQEVEKKLAELPEYHRKKISSINNLKAVIKGLLLQDILLNISLKKGYDKESEVLQTISKYNNYLLLKYKRKEIAEAKSFPDSLLYKYYSDNLNLFRNEDELNIQEIIVERNSLADSLVSMLNKGNDFGTLAKKYSERKWSAENNGEMGFAEVSKFGMLKDTLWKSSIGRVIGPIKIESMYGIFKILGKKIGEPRKFDDIKSGVQRILTAEKSKEIVNEYIEEIKKKVSVKINEQALGSVSLTN